MPLVVVPVALVVGLALGALGGGGSILTVPALVYLLGLGPREATTGSLVIVGLTSVIAAAPHHRAGRVALGQGLVFGVLGAAGALAGARASGLVAPDVLLLGFAVLMLVVATVMVVRLRSGSRASGDPAAEPVLRWRPWRCDCRRLALLLVTATGVGLLTGFFGVGGGFVIVPALLLALRLPMPVAVGTSLVVIAVNSATSLAFRLGDGTSLDLAVVLPFTGLAVLGSLAGGRLAGRADPRRLTIAFVVLLVAVAGYSLVRSVLALT